MLSVLFWFFYLCMVSITALITSLTKHFELVKWPVNESGESEIYAFSVTLGSLLWPVYLPIILGILPASMIKKAYDTNVPKV